MEKQGKKNNLGPSWAGEITSSDAPTWNLLFLYLFLTSLSFYLNLKKIYQMRKKLKIKSYRMLYLIGFRNTVWKAGIISWHHPTLHVWTHWYLVKSRTPKVEVWTSTRCWEDANFQLWRPCNQPRPSHCLIALDKDSGHMTTDRNRLV